MRKSQQGTSYLSILLGVLLFAVVVKAATALWPAYWDDQVINSQIEELLQHSSSDITAAQFDARMDQRLKMNNIYDLNVMDIIKVTTNDGLNVSKRYEVRKNFLLNIDLVLTFEKNFDQKSVQAK